MRVARYIGSGQIAIVDEQRPTLPSGGLIVQSEACGLCSGELMSWYMDRKIPHVLGHEVSGLVIESDSAKFPVGVRVFPHHHAPCNRCEFCLTGRYVHCEQWKLTKLKPGGMADFFSVTPENLTDTLRTDDLRPRDSALIEPLACVWKSLKSSRLAPSDRTAVIGLGSMGLLHMLLAPESAIGYDLSDKRLRWARDLGLQVRKPEEAAIADIVFVCPGSQAAFDKAMEIVAPGGTIVMFAPLGPNESLQVPNKAYFADVKILNSYSCGPDDTEDALESIRAGVVRAEQICSDFVELEDLPRYYKLMKSGEILKPMVLWS